MIIDDTVSFKIEHAQQYNLRMLEQVARFVLLEGIFGRGDASNKHVCLLMFLTVLD